MNKNYNIDDIIKSRLQNFSINEKPQDFNIVSKGIKKYKQKLMLKKIAIISVILLIASIGLLYLNQNKITNNKSKNNQVVYVNKSPKQQTTNNKTKESKEPSTNKTKQQKTFNTTITKNDNKPVKNKTTQQTTNKTTEINTENNDTDTQQTTNKIINNIILPNADFNIDYKEGCQPLKVQFLPAEISDTMIYYWNFGDGTSSNETSPTHIYTQAGKFTVSLTVKYFRTRKIISKSYRDLIKVYELPQSNFDYTNQGSKYYFSNKSKGTKTNIWLGFDGKIITEKSPEYDFSKNGNYTISLVSISQNGCSDTLTKQITVNTIEQITLFMPNAFTPDGDGINDYFGVTQPLEYKEFYMQIFDLQGNLLYLSNNKQKMWDGKNRQNKPVPSGKYIWKVLIKPQKGNEIQKTGYLNLIK